MSTTPTREQWPTTIECVECKKPFNFPASEHDYYHERNFTPPKRCKECRAKAKARAEQRKEEIAHDPITQEELADVHRAFDDLIDLMGIDATVTSAPGEYDSPDGTTGTKMIIAAKDSANKGMLIGREGWVATALRTIAFCVSKASAHTFTIEITGPDKDETTNGG